MFRNRTVKIKRKTLPGVSYHLPPPGVSSSRTGLLKGGVASASAKRHHIVCGPTSMVVQVWTRWGMVETGQLTSPVFKRKPSSYLVKPLCALLPFWHKGEIKWCSQAPLLFISLLNSREIPWTTSVSLIDCSWAPRKKKTLLILIKSWQSSVALTSLGTACYVAAFSHSLLPAFTCCLIQTASTAAMYYKSYTII